MVRRGLVHFFFASSGTLALRLMPCESCLIDHRLRENFWVHAIIEYILAEAHWEGQMELII